MQRYLAALTIVLLLGMVLTRVFLMKKAGTRAMHFGNIDKRDYLIPPFALFYFYTVFAAAFNLPIVSTQEFFHSEVISWAGVFLCLGGLIVLLLSIVSFGKSFRVGIDVDNPDKLVTTSVFAFSRNPIYTAFGIVLLGQFLPLRVIPLRVRSLMFRYPGQVLEIHFLIVQDPSPNPPAMPFCYLLGSYRKHSSEYRVESKAFTMNPVGSNLIR